MKVKVKKLVPTAVIPTYAKDSDAGLDLTATSFEIDEIGNFVYGTGLAFEIPAGFVGFLFPRSSNSKKDLLLSNSVGVVDAGYRGEVILKYKNISKDKVSSYSVGERCGQIIIMPYPSIELEEAEELSTSERGTGGFGSTN